VLTINLKAGQPDLDTARRRLLAEMEKARKSGARVLKIVHGWGSSGRGGKLAVGIRRSLRLRVKEGKAVVVVPGERFSSDSIEGRELLRRYPSLRRDRDCNRLNPGITIIELSESA
jgi:hypothetical protein